MLGISRRLLIAIYLPSAAILIATALGSIYAQTPIDVLTRDPTDVGRVHPLSGILSNLGILLWCSSAAVCLFSGLALRHTGRTEASSYLVVSGLLTVVLLFDDLFQFHESLADRYLGLTERSVFAAYVLVTVTYLIVFRSWIFRTAWVLLLAALMFFALSIGVDLLERWLWRLGGWKYYVEDALKFFGIASWCGYFVGVAYQLLFAVRPISEGTSPDRSR